MDRTCLDYLNANASGYRWDKWLRHMKVRCAMLGVDSIDEKARIFQELKDTGYTRINGTLYTCKYFRYANGHISGKVLLVEVK